MVEINEIRRKIKGIQNTCKITKAMEMIAASKMRRAQERMWASRPYCEKIRCIVARVSKSNRDYRHPFMICPVDAKRVGIILITTDKGLCGGMNTNILRMVVEKYQELEKLGFSIETTAIGSKGDLFLSRFGARIVSKIVQSGDTPHLEKLICAVKIQLDAFASGKLNSLYLAYTRFVNAMKQEPVIEKVLPLSETNMQLGINATYRDPDYIYEPDARSVIDSLLMRYVEALIYQSVVENVASEQSARMIAMKAASDNANNIISEMQLLYNKSRQAQITKELSEIVGGAAAV